MPACLGTDINRDDVSNLPTSAFCYQKSKPPVCFFLDLASPLQNLANTATIHAVPINRLCRSLGDQRKSSPAPHIRPQFVSRIGNSRSKARLVNLPERVELFRPVVAHCVSHPHILAARPTPRCKVRTITDLPYSGNLANIYNENVALLHPTP